MQLVEKSLKQKLLSGSAWVLSGKIVTAFSGLAVNALLTRILTPVEVGAYFLTFSLVAVAAIVAQLGLTRTIVRLVAESIATNRPARARRSVILVFRFAALGGLIVASVLSFGGSAWVAEQLFHSEIMSNVTGLIVVWVLILLFQDLLAEVYRGFHDIRLATIFGGLVTGVLSMGFFLVLWWSQGYSNFHQVILLTLVAGSSSVVFSSLILWKKLSIFPSSENNQDDQIRASKIISISWPLWITSLSLFVLHQADLWIMGLFRTAEEVAVYGVAARTVVLVAMPFVIVSLVVPPIITEMYAQGKTRELERTLRGLATLVGLPALVVLGAFIFFGDIVLELLFGSYYQAGGAVLAILSVGQIANVWAGSCGQVLMFTGRQAQMMYITVFSGSLTIILALLLVPAYGAVGVAFATSFGMIFQNLLVLLFTKKSIGIWTSMSFSTFRQIINRV